MDKEAISAKMQAASDEFDGLEKQRQDIVTRQQQLQGSYQTLQSLLNEADPAATISAKEDTSKKAKVTQ